MGQGHQRDTSFAECLTLLREFGQAGAQVLVVGGQAVNFWAEVFEAEERELEAHRPFASTDLDLHRPDVNALRVLRSFSQTMETERDPFGKAFTPVSHTFFLRNPAGHLLTVESLKSVSGLRPSEVRKGTVTAEFAGARIAVLNPLACLKAKLYNVRTIDQHQRQDEKHVRILIICSRGFIRRLLTEAQRNSNYRPVLKALQQILLLTSRRENLQIAREHGFNLGDCLPLAELAASQHPKLQNFMARQFPRGHALVGRAG